MRGVAAFLLALAVFASGCVPVGVDLNGSSDGNRISEADAKGGIRGKPIATPVPSATPAPQPTVVPTPVSTPAPTATPAPGGVLVTAYGAKGDGITDDTAAFRAAANSKLPILVPKPAAFYKVSGSIYLYNSVSGDGSMPEIRMFGATGGETHIMFWIRNYQGPGLTVSGLRLNGQWDGLNYSGEWSHLIEIQQSSNITIKGNYLENAHGDAVIMAGNGSGSPLLPSRNIIIVDNTIINPERCAIAALSVNGLIIQRNTIHKLNYFVAAIDFEPDPNGVDSVWNANVSNNNIRCDRDPRNAYNAAAPAISFFHTTLGTPYDGHTCDIGNCIPSDGYAGGNITVHDNTGFSQWGFVFVNPTSASLWSNIRAWNNPDPLGTYPQ